MKLEYLIYVPREPHHPWKVLLCEDDHIIARREFSTFGLLCKDVAPYRGRGSAVRIAVELKDGTVVPFSRFTVEDLPA